MPALGILSDSCAWVQAMAGGLGSYGVESGHFLASTPLASRSGRVVFQLQGVGGQRDPVRDLELETSTAKGRCRDHELSRMGTVAIRPDGSSHVIRMVPSLQKGQRVRSWPVRRFTLSMTLSSSLAGNGGGAARSSRQRSSFDFRCRLAKRPK